MLLNNVSSILTSIYSKNYILCYLLILCVYMCKHMRELKQYLILQDALTFFYSILLYCYFSVLFHCIKKCWALASMYCSLQLGRHCSRGLVNADILGALVVGDLILQEETGISMKCILILIILVIFSNQESFDTEGIILSLPWDVLSESST